MAATWHYIPPLVAPGDTHMAIDAWLLEQHRLGLRPATLRFYTWSPTAISLGYHQRRYPEAWKQLSYQGQAVDLVRRPSGGRAVLHQGDLTYALITSSIPGDRHQVYAKLCQFLIDGFASLGLPLQYGHHQRQYHHDDSCFRTHTKADLVTTQGYKFIGSAQLRRQGAILQHGSIRLAPDPQLYSTVFGEALKIPPELTLYPQKQVISALTQSLQDSFEVNLQVTDLNEFNKGQPAAIAI